MRKLIIILLAAVVTAGFTACNGGKSGSCRIHGVVGDPQLNGKTLYLVPFTNHNPGNVDSVVIQDGKFEMTSDTFMVAKLILDYHYRFGTQTLLIVTEPGDVNVTFGSESSGGGTPLNDSLQAWKTATELHNLQIGTFMKQKNEAEKAGNKAQAEVFKTRADSVHLAYKQLSRRLAGSVSGTVLGDFLNDMFPLKYKRQKPDSTMVWVDADTQEELGPVTE